MISFAQKDGFCLTAPFHRKCNSLETFHVNKNVAKDTDRNMVGSMGAGVDHNSSDLIDAMFDCSINGKAKRPTRILNAP